MLIKKVLVALGVTIAITGVLVFSITGSADPNLAKTKVASSEANYPLYKDLEEVEKASSVVVVARYQGERENYEVKPAGLPGVTLSKTQVHVERVIKGDLEKGKKLTVYEEGAIVKGTYVNTEGYKWMDKKGEYLLFLRKISDEQAFAIVGIYQGKFDLSNHSKKQAGETITQLTAALSDQEVEFLGDAQDFERFTKLKDQAVKKYQE
ncbi:hypothetical protein [Tumebacillus permanentifrigoris]|uniref:Uncharacterized protein n=1 Tax=Tumebacillus permanentifrigoris TaxID=378543 RepID=A0A316DFW9_9BACL|nr:hypothetical protein [Tumebacillus permanentifrigoris]PWK16508.1 hypothetical protein C7459_101374 [Tumebacillus permanentifrigoris]